MSLYYVSSHAAQPPFGDEMLVGGDVLGPLLDQEALVQEPHDHFRRNFVCFFPVAAQIGENVGPARPCRVAMEGLVMADGDVTRWVEQWIGWSQR